MGVAIGILSAFLAAIFAAMNKRHVERGDPLAVTGVELAAGALFLTVLACVFLPSGATIPIPGMRDAALLLLLAIACTLFPFALALVALRHVSAFSAQLAISLEPVYAVLLAIVLLGEQKELGATFYLGLAIILIAVFGHAAAQRTGEPQTH